MFIIGKDKIIGVVIFLLGIVVAILYTLGSIWDLFLQSALAGALQSADGFVMPLLPIDLFDWTLFVVLPLWLIVILVGIIMIWIGWSMITTPAPIPLEELEEELAAEEAAGK